jgi:S-adenosylmethionine decarboxylase
MPEAEGLTKEALRSSQDVDAKAKRDYCDRLNGKRGEGFLPAEPKDIDYFLHWKIKCEEYRERMDMYDMKLIDEFFAFKDKLCYTDLAPDIVRQRLVIEGELKSPFAKGEMVVYSKELSDILDMTPISEPQSSFAEQYGWCCFMHWKESGMHIYSWDHRKPPFFSVDIYTCKTFAWGDALRYTESFFGDDLLKITHKPDGGVNGNRQFPKRERWAGAKGEE